MSIAKRGRAMRVWGRARAPKSKRVSQLNVFQVDKMDRKTEQGKKRDWSWLPEAMPGVRKLIIEKRQALGDEWVNKCWRHGVVEAQPGWFFAAEGSLTLGVPIDAEPVLAFYRLQVQYPAAVLLDLRKPEGAV